MRHVVEYIVVASSSTFDETTDAIVLRFCSIKLQAIKRGKKEEEKKKGKKKNIKNLAVPSSRP